MPTQFDRDPLTFEITGVTDGASPFTLLPLKPRRKNEVWVCEYVSVHLEGEALEGDATHLVEFGIDHRAHITWLDYIVLAANLWIRILDHPVTLLSDTLPRVRIFDAASNLYFAMNAVGYVRAPFTTP